MNITFLIGNGFDLNLDVKTDYRSFLKYYCSCSSEIEEGKGEDPDIIAFKKIISEDIELWSDLEKKLGQATVDKPLNTDAGLIKCKTDLDKHLCTFLKEKQKSLSFPNTSDFERNMRKSVEQFPTFFTKQMQDELLKIFQKYRTEDRKYNFITFNYTDLFDRCFSVLPERLGEHTSGTITHSHKKGDLIHIHGSVDMAMLVGVDGKDQIANKELAENHRVQRYMIKPRMNIDSQIMRDQQAQKIIESSQIIIVFGMAIGETDRSWWEAIANCVAHNGTELILVNYQSGINSAFTYLSADAEERMIEHFLNVCGCTGDEMATIREHTHAYFNTAMFKIPHKIATSDTHVAPDVA